ncbi:MAG: RluA family pseudouridine synthase [Pseudomonadota bacterium]
MPSKPTSLEVPADATTRLDRFLAERFAGISRAFLQGLIERGQVTVNGYAARKGHVLAPGDRVEVGAFVLPQERRIAPNPGIPLNIVWQSEELVVFSKAAGIPTHPNDYKDLNTLANALLARFPEIADVGDDHLRPGIVHRLDTDTSGLIVVARTQEAFRTLRGFFDERKIRKVYQALVLGDVATDGEITTPVAHHAKNPRKMVAVTEGAPFRSRVREARTMYRPLERFGDYTLLEVRTLTGRMHQVRVHLSSIEHPLAGDRIYQTARDHARDHSGLKRHFLHAVQLGIPLGKEGEIKMFSDELSAELAEVLRSLRSRPRPGEPG